MRYLISISTLILIIFSACSSPDEAPAERGFEDDKIEQLNNLEKYDYNRDIPPPSNKVVQLFINILSWIGRLFSSIIGYLALAVLIGLLIWVVMRNVDMKGQPAQDPAPSVRFVDEEDLEKMDFEKVLQLALGAEDYRLGIRYSFLRSLQYLQLKKLIDWNKEKTNYQFLNELPEEYRSEFKSMVRIYEYVWYGEFPASRELYADLHQSGENLKKGFR